MTSDGDLESILTMHGVCTPNTIQSLYVFNLSDLREEFKEQKFHDIDLQYMSRSSPIIITD